MNTLKNKRIAVFGLGVSGVGAIKLLSYLETSIIAINSGEPQEWSKTQGVLDFVAINNCFSEVDEKLFGALDNVDLMILSPGIPRDHKIVAYLLNKNIPVWGEIELAYRVLMDFQKLSPIIGITGTNGKTTTTTLIGEMLSISKKTVFVGGNIGVPFSLYAYELLTQKIPKKVDFIVLELSSFQLESIEEFRVDIALFLNLYQNHGERYEHIEDYAKSKMLITNKFTPDSHIILSDQSSLILNWSKTVVGKKTVISNTKPVINFNVDQYKLPGIHNKINLAFALRVAEIIGLEKSLVQKCINEFTGVHHRIEAVTVTKNFKNTRVFNDAKSTNWDATLTAVAAMKEYQGPIYLIIGGKKRGHGDSIAPYFEFLNSQVYFFYLIGETSNEIEGEMRQLGIDENRYLNAKTLEAVVLDFKSKKESREGTQVLLFSPAFPSFDQFKNYAHRGEVFKSELAK